MTKLDTSTGLSGKDIDAVKYSIKRRIERELPELPEAVEEQLLLQGRTPWNYSWRLLNTNLPVAAKEILVIELTVKLKREFSQQLADTRYTFRCRVHRTDDVYNPVVEIEGIA